MRAKFLNKIGKQEKNLPSRYKRFAILFARMLVAGNIDYQKLMNVSCNPKEAQPRWKTNWILKKPQVQLMIQEEIKKIYDESGLSVKDIIAKSKRLYNKTVKEKNYLNAVSILKIWSESQGLINQKGKVEQTQPPQHHLPSSLQENFIKAKNGIKESSGHIMDERVS